MENQNTTKKEKTRELTGHHIFPHFSHWGFASATSANELATGSGFSQEPWIDPLPNFANPDSQPPGSFPASHRVLPSH